LSQYFTATNAHYALTACGFEQTLIGGGCGLLDGILYATEGNWIDAGLSSFGMIPVIGATGDYAKAAKLAADAALAAKGIKVLSLSDLPLHVQSAYSKLSATGWKTGVGVGEGVRSGAEFKNVEQLLPVQNYGYYREFGVNSISSQGVADAERFVVGNMGEIYYTVNHYQAGSFVKIK
jgi:guanyl-specific ribonuclease Sa